MWSFRKQQLIPQAWASQIMTRYDGDTVYLGWVKVVSVKKPSPYKTPIVFPRELGVMGPFRSEMDCDEFVRSANSGCTPEKDESEKWKDK